MADIKELLQKAAAHLRSTSGVNDYPLSIKLDDAAESLGEPVAWRAVGPSYTVVVTDPERATESRWEPLYLVPQPAVPEWKDPYTNNGDARPDTDYRHGWNACRDAMLAAAGESRHE